MKRTYFLLLVALYPAILRVPHKAEASPLAISASIYPRGAHISYWPTLTNAEMDCMWGFFCEGDLPLFHFQTQDQLHRLAGWGQFAGVEHRGQAVMGFQVFVSRYDPEPTASRTHWSQLAFLDLRAAIRQQGYQLSQHNADLLLAAGEGGTLVAVQRSGKQDLVVMASWFGSTEIEAVAFYAHHSVTARRTAWVSLAQQVRRASDLGA